MTEIVDETTEELEDEAVEDVPLTAGAEQEDEEPGCTVEGGLARL